MLTGIQHAHSGLRWILLLLLIWSVIKGAMGRKGDARFFDKTRKLALMTMITAHIQLLLGLVLYFGNAHHKVFSTQGGMAEPILRFFAVEHLVGMLLGIVMITIGYRKVKSAATDVAKYKALFLYYLVGLILILAMIPWPFRSGFEAYGWF